MGDSYVLGEIRIFTGTYDPVCWLRCDGSLLPISEYEDLFQLIGTQFGGDGNNTVGLPKLADPSTGGHYYICIQGVFPAPNVSVDGAIAEIRLMAVSAAPQGWIPCDGRSLSLITEDINVLVLFTMIRIRFGGDGQRAFNVPNLAAPLAGLLYVLCLAGVDPQPS